MVGSLIFECAIEMLKPNKNDRLQIYENPMKVVVKIKSREKTYFLTATLHIVLPLSSLTKSEPSFITVTATGRP